MIPILGALVAFGSAFAANPALPAPEAGVPPAIVLARHHHHHWRHRRWGRYAYRYDAPAPGAGAVDYDAVPQSGSPRQAPEPVQAPAAGSSSETAPSRPAGPRIRWVDPPSPAR